MSFLLKVLQKSQLSVTKVLSLEQPVLRICNKSVTQLPYFCNKSVILSGRLNYIDFDII